MAYTALYRSWRPQDFNHLIGQEHISKTLANALIIGRITHAYLFAGPRGTGKTSTAKILAKALNCLKCIAANPCNQCLSCKRITGGSSMDVFEIDAASNRGIDEIRELRETVKFAPIEGRYKVYIIDEVHMLTTEAFNALLKTLEEPPAHVVFILATTEAHKIPATIHSRCQRYDFRKIAVQEIEKSLSVIAKQLEMDITSEALKLIAIHADGAMRDALSILDQCTTMNITTTVTGLKVRQMLGLIGHEWIFQLTTAMLDKDSSKTLLLMDEIIATGKDVKQILTELIQFLRGLMLYKSAPASKLELYGQENEAGYKELSAKISQEELIWAIKQSNEAIVDLRWAVDARTIAEMALLNICSRALVSVEELAHKIAVLEKKVNFGEGEYKSLKSAANVSPGRVRKENYSAADSKNNNQLALNSSPAAPATAGIIVPANRVEYTDLKGIWNAVLKELIAGGKRSIHACVAQGQLVALDDSQACVQFTASFPKERTEKEDFRSIIEKIVAQVSGKNVKLTCLLGVEGSVRATAKSHSEAKHENKAIVLKQAAAKPEEHPAVSQALKMFGGKVTSSENNKEVDI